MNHVPESLLTVDEVASMLRVPRQTLYVWRVLSAGGPAMRQGASASPLPAGGRRGMARRPIDCLVVGASWAGASISPKAIWASASRSRPCQPMIPDSAPMRYWPN
jgi:hypothetical protein